MNDIKVRTYQETDAPTLAMIYYHTIHNINIRDYSEEQVNAWAPYDSVEDYSGWQKKLAMVRPFVAVINDIIVGFAEFEPNGHIDCFYVHHEFQGKGVGSALMVAIVDKAQKEDIVRIFAEVSITARPFFEAKGFQLVKEQQVTIRGVKLTNFVMEKNGKKREPFIATARCILRLPELEEAIAMAEFASKNRAYLIPFEPLQPDYYYGPEYWHDKILQLQEGFQADTSCCLNLYLKETGQLLGMVNYSNIVRGAFHSCFLGFKIAENMQGQGLMTEAIKASIGYVFDTLNLHRISANYMPRNERSARVLEKCGFQKEGIAEDYLRINGTWEQHVLTSLINDKWKNG